MRLCTCLDCSIEFTSLGSKKRCFLCNKKRISELSKQNQQRNKHKYSEYYKKYRTENKAQIYQKIVALLKNRPDIKLRRTLGTRIANALKYQNAHKDNSTVELLGISIRDFKLYLESLFMPGMTWENRSEWHIDHIIPCCAFNLIDPRQQKVCFNYKNLRPLWKVDNLKKISQDKQYKLAAKRVADASSKTGNS